MVARANATARATAQAAISIFRAIFNDFVTFWRFSYSTPVTRDMYENFRIFEAL
jgi:hypothetical protein